MKLLLDSCWRAAVYCLHPRVIALSVLPLVLMAASALALGYFFWEPAIDAVRATLESWALVATMLAWLDSVGLSGLRTALAPMIIVFVSTPVIVVLSLLAVASMMTPAVLALVRDRRFATLERKRGGSFAGSLFGALWATVVALLALLVTIPLWLVPPLVLIVPPLIWGWLTYRVMSYDVLADHASAEERALLIERHRPQLFAIGVLTGYLGAAPSLVWAFGAMAIALAPVLIPVAIWIYTLVFAFAALWFSHYALAALQALRAEPAVTAPAAMPIELLPAEEPPLLLTQPQSPGAGTLSR